MKSGVKDSQGGLPMHLATIRIIVQSAKKRESSQPLFAVAYMWPKKLWWCSWYKKFSNLVWSKKFFLLYFTILFFSFLVSICFFLLYFWPRFDVLKSEKNKHFQSCFRKPCYAIKLAEMPVVNQLTRKKKPHPEIIGFLLSIMCCRPSASFKVNWSKAFLWRKRPHRVCMPEDNFFHYFAAKHCCRSCCSLLSLPSIPWRTVGVVQH